MTHRNKSAGGSTGRYTVPIAVVFTSIELVSLSNMCFYFNGSNNDNATLDVYACALSAVNCSLKGKSRKPLSTLAVKNVSLWYGVRAIPC